MPYYITDSAEECANWAVIKDDGEVIGCHESKESAIDQMVAISLEEGIEPGGERDTKPAEQRQVDLRPPAYMRASARRGLAYYEDGKGGDGLVPRTIREARAMAAGNVTADKWVRIRAWIARHLVDLDAPAARPSSPDYPSAGVVAMLLWGGGSTKRSAQRALDYADSVVGRLEAENEGRAKGEVVKKLEVRTNPATFEIRETGDGFTFEGYAAVFNSPSEPLPFTERIAPGAFKRSLQTRNDIKLLWNHESGAVLASTRAKTLSLTEDDKGLFVSASIADTSYGRDARELIRRGDVDSMSFGFSVIKDSWSKDGNERTLESVRLYEVSITPWPAYPATAGTTSVRGLDLIAQRADISTDELDDAIMKLEEGQELSSAESELLKRIIGELSPAVEEAPATEEPKGSKELLALKKKKLELLTKGI
jgi:uncharacterized protein